MGLKDENAELLKKNGQLETKLEVVSKRFVEVRDVLEERNKVYESLLKQAGEINAHASDLDRQSDELRFKISQLEKLTKDLQAQNTTLIQTGIGHAQIIADLAASLKAVTKK